MASFFTISLLFLLSLVHISLSIPDVHDLMKSYGFPRGLIPNAVKSYSISENGEFIIKMTQPCYVQFEQLVYYDEKIKGKIKYGSVTGVSGIQAKKLFIWVSVTGIEVDQGSGMMEFWVGPLSHRLPVDQFEEIPECKNKGCHLDHDVQDSPIQSI